MRRADSTVLVYIYITLSATLKGNVLERGERARFGCTAAIRLSLPTPGSRILPIQLG
jgi:hypothetical protein